MNAKNVHYEQQEKITNIKILNKDIAVLSRIGDWGKEKNVHPYIHACVYFYVVSQNTEVVEKLKSRSDKSHIISSLFPLFQNQHFLSFYFGFIRSYSSIIF